MLDLAPVCLFETRWTLMKPGAFVIELLYTYFRHIAQALAIKLILLGGSAAERNPLSGSFLKFTFSSVFNNLIFQPPPPSFPSAFHSTLLSPET